jgi:hypothetical protein
MLALPRKNKARIRTQNRYENMPSYFAFVVVPARLMDGMQQSMALMVRHSTPSPRRIT